MNDSYKTAIFGQVMHKESPKNQTAIPSKVPGPWLHIQPSDPTHFRLTATVIVRKY